MNILETRHLTKNYSVGQQTLTVLDDVSLSIADGEFWVVEGNSGSGKTTLLSLLSGSDRPSAGRILIAGTDITGFSEDALAPLRNRTFGFVFQSFHLVPALSALENVMFPAELNQDPRAAEKAGTLLARVGLQERQDHLPHQLSGGEKQRVAICRALVNTPKILFADEPTGNLDQVNGRAVLDLLLELRAEQQTTLVLATHSQEIAARADRVIQLDQGRLVQRTAEAVHAA